MLTEFTAVKLALLPKNLAPITVPPTGGVADTVFDTSAPVAKSMIVYEKLLLFGGLCINISYTLPVDAVKAVIGVFVVVAAFLIENDIPASVLSIRNPALLYINSPELTGDATDHEMDPVNGSALLLIMVLTAVDVPAKNLPPAVQISNPPLA